MSIYRHSYIVDAEGRFIHIGVLHLLYEIRTFVYELITFLKKNTVMSIAM